MNFLKKLRAKSVVRNVEYHKGKTQKKNLEELLFRATELAGESGEVCDAIKKYARGQRNMSGGKSEKESIFAIQEELADTLICVERVAEFFDLDLEKITKLKFNATSKKRGFKTKFASYE